MVLKDKTPDIACVVSRATTARTIVVLLTASSFLISLPFC